MTTYEVKWEDFFRSLGKSFETDTFQSVASTNVDLFAYVGYAIRESVQKQINLGILAGRLQRDKTCMDMFILDMVTLAIKFMQSGSNFTKKGKIKAAGQEKLRPILDSYDIVQRPDQSPEPSLCLTPNRIMIIVAAPILCLLKNAGKWALNIKTIGDSEILIKRFRSPNAISLFHDTKDHALIAKAWLVWHEKGFTKVVDPKGENSGPEQRAMFLELTYNNEFVLNSELYESLLPTDAELEEVHRNAAAIEAEFQTLDRSIKGFHRKIYGS